MCIELPGLSELDLGCTGLWDVSRDVLRSWSTLQHLNLAQNDLDNDFIEDLMKADLPCLKSLGCRLFDSSEQLSLLTSAQWPMLESLDMSRLRRCHYIIRALRASCFPHLTSLYLSHVRFLESDAAVLVTSNFPKLRLLNLDYNRVDYYEMHACITTLVLGQWPLDHLSMRGTFIAEESVSFLLDKGWPTLERLDLPNDFEEFCDIFAGLGTACHSPLQLGLFYLHAPKCSCVCALQRLKLVTFYD